MKYVVIFATVPTWSYFTFYLYTRAELVITFIEERRINNNHEVQT